MKRNDEMRQLISEYQNMAVPKSARQRVQEGIARGMAHAAKRRRAAYIRAAASCAAAAAVVLILLPNVSPEMADALGKAPVLGGFFRAVTIREYHLKEASDENNASDESMQLGRSLNQDLGSVAGSSGSVEAQAGGADDLPLGSPIGELEVPAVINDAEPADGVSVQSLAVSAEEYTSALVERFSQEIKREGTDLSDIHYEVITDSEEWFTLAVYAQETDEDGGEVCKYYNVDRQQDAVVTLDDLYGEIDYQSIIRNEILREMQATADSEKAVAGLPGEKWEDSIPQIQEDQNYYFNEDGDLVIRFEIVGTDSAESECAEYVSVEFAIDPELLQ